MVSWNEKNRQNLLWESATPCLSTDPRDCIAKLQGKIDVGTIASNLQMHGVRLYCKPCGDVCVSRILDQRLLLNRAGRV